MILNILGGSTVVGASWIVVDIVICPVEGGVRRPQVQGTVCIFVSCGEAMLVSLVWRGDWVGVAGSIQVILGSILMVLIQWWCGFSIFCRWVG